MLRSHSNEPSGRRYSEMYEHVLRRLAPELAAESINATDRMQFVWCAQNRLDLEKWRNTKPQKQRDRWNHPDAVKRNSLADQKAEKQAQSNLLPPLPQPPRPRSRSLLLS